MKIESIYKNLEYDENGPAVRKLFETEFTKEIRILMREGQVMKEHQTSFPIVVQVVDGNIDFGVKGSILNLEKGALLALDGGMPHDLKAKEDSIVRLTLTKSDTADRVKRVVKE